MMHNRKPIVVAMLKKLIAVVSSASTDWRAKARKIEAYETLSKPSSSECASAVEVTRAIAPAAVAARKASLEQAMKCAGVDKGAAPLAAIRAWARAKQDGIDVDAMFQERVSVLEMESVRNNVDSTVSGLRAWHLFATGALGIPADASSSVHSAHSSFHHGLPQRRHGVALHQPHSKRL